MKNLLKQIALIVCISGIIISCQDNYSICDTPKEVSFKGAFYKKSGNLDVLTPVTSLSVSPLGVPSYIYYQQPGITNFGFALNPALDSAKYIFKINNGSMQDTVALFYSSLVQTLSPECGTITTHQLIGSRTTTHVLDSIRITSGKIDNKSDVNMKVYFH